MKKDWRRTSIEKRNSKTEQVPRGKVRQKQSLGTQPGGGAPSLQAGYVAAPGERRRVEPEPALRNSSPRERHLLAGRPGHLAPGRAQAPSPPALSHSDPNGPA